MSTHIIHRQFLDGEVQGTESEAFALQETLLALCRDWLNPALEDVFERLIPPHEHWTIDRLEIEAGSLRPKRLARGLIEVVTQAVERHLREGTPRAGSTFSSGSIQR